MTAPTIPTPQQPYFTAGGPRGWFVAFRATEAGETKDILVRWFYSADYPTGEPGAAEAARRAAERLNTYPHIPTAKALADAVRLTERMRESLLLVAFETLRVSMPEEHRAGNTTLAAMMLLGKAGL